MDIWVSSTFWPLWIMLLWTYVCTSTFLSPCFLILLDILVININKNILIFWGTILVSTVAALFYIPTRSTQGFQFLHILTETITLGFVFLILAIQWMKWAIALWLWFLFPWWWVMLGIFSVFYWPFVYIFWKQCLFKSFVVVLVAKSCPTRRVHGLWPTRLFWFMGFPSLRNVSVVCSFPSPGGLPDSRTDQVYLHWQIRFYLGHREAPFQVLAHS